FERLAVKPLFFERRGEVPRIHRLVRVALDQLRQVLNGQVRAAVPDARDGQAVEQLRVVMNERGRRLAELVGAVAAPADHVGRREVGQEVAELLVRDRECAQELDVAHALGLDVVGRVVGLGAGGGRRRAERERARRQQRGKEELRGVREARGRGQHLGPGRGALSGQGGQRGACATGGAGPRGSAPAASSGAKKSFAASEKRGGGASIWVWAGAP